MHRNVILFKLPLTREPNPIRKVILIPVDSYELTVVTKAHPSALLGWRPSQVGRCRANLPEQIICKSVGSTAEVALV